MAHNGSNVDMWIEKVGGEKSGAGRILRFLSEKGGMTFTRSQIALAIGITTHCDGCVAYHAKMAHQHGATRQEVLER